MTPGFALDYCASFDHTWAEDTPAERVRFVVLDSETTGLDPRHDRLISLGAVAVLQREIHLADAFETLLSVAYNSAAVTVHGITRDQARDGLGEPEALEQFIAYLKDGVIVGHHIGHDIAILNSACGRHFGFALRNRWIDTMDLALHLERDGAFAGGAEIKSFSLDALCQRFGVIPHDRHTAGGDAFLTAQVFLKLLRLAQRSGRRTLAALTERYVAEKH
ncbi:MAG: PolC-type DNA polymerase III [Chromatiales bacterium]